MVVELARSLEAKCKLMYFIHRSIINNRVIATRLLLLLLLFQAEGCAEAREKIFFHARGVESSPVKRSSRTR